MTSERTDRELQAKLDQFTVPPLPSAFADRVVAATAGREAQPAALPLRRTSSNPDRRPWRRPGHVLAGAVALSLVSAAAAATGAFGNAARTAVADAPVIGPIIVETIPQIANKPAVPVRQAKARPELENAPDAGASRADAPGAVAEAAPPVTRREAVREMIASRVASRIEQRNQRRAELGLPPAPPPRAAVVRALRRLPPEDRRAIIQRVREIRAERLQTQAGATAAPEVAAPPPPVPPATAADPAAAAAIPEVQAEGPQVRQPASRAERLQRLRQIRDLRRQRRQLRN